MNVERRVPHMTPTRKKKTLMVKLTVTIQETFGIHCLDSWCHPKQGWNTTSTQGIQGVKMRRESGDWGKDKR